MSKHLKKISRTETVKVDDEKDIKLHITLRFLPPPKKKMGRRKNGKMGRSYHLVVKQGNTELYSNVWKRIDGFPIANMRDELTANLTVSDITMSFVSFALKLLRDQLLEAERRL